MRDDPYNVLFLCTGNSARSIIGESLLNAMGQGRFRAFSAGSQPRGEVNPDALRLLEKMQLPVTGLHSKSWTAFAGPNAPVMDFVFTVCDQAAAEACPVWPGQPMSAHWGMPDPAAVTGDDEIRLQAFRATFFELQRRLGLFINLPVRSLDRMALKRAMDEIGGSSDRSAS
ncbi:MAG: ArsR family transcriptional regulator [Salinisphaeraceae bacterium]|jgi:arsenate reductase|nr:ArsR family transcriptional regulator [Salinisphaeraceae bacterium]